MLAFESGLSASNTLKSFDSSRTAAHAQAVPAARLLLAEFEDFDMEDVGNVSALKEAAAAPDGVCSIGKVQTLQKRYLEPTLRAVCETQRRKGSFH